MVVVSIIFRFLLLAAGARPVVPLVRKSWGRAGDETARQASEMATRDLLPFDNDYGAYKSELR